jgi:Na+:H+ antiporter
VHVATNILVVGTLIFIAHAFTGIFSRARVPDVLLLTIIGIVRGPMLHLVRPANFGNVGPVFTTVTLINILFEAGLSLNFDIIRGSIRSTLSLTLINFFLTMATVGIAAHFLLGLGFRLTLMLGAIVGSTSPAVIVPLTRRMHMEQCWKTILFLESALSDVLSIVVAIGFMDSYKLGTLHVTQMIGQVFAIRIPAAWLGLARTVPVRDASLVAIMSPKGLAAVVLASMPLEQQIREGPMLQSVTYSVVFLSIVLTSVFSFLIERTILAKFYGALFRGFGREAAG